MATELRHPLDDALIRVRDMLRSGMPFEHIEARILDAGLDEELESVLWLYAWCGGAVRDLRAIVMADETPTT